MIKKIIETGEVARRKILKGVNAIGTAVGATIGPAGRNAIIYRKYKSPLITNDGVSIARHMYMEDEIEDLGAQTMVEAALKTNEQAGDGTTTTVVIAEAIVKKCFKDLSSANLLGADKPNAMKMKREIDAAKEKVVALLKERKEDLKEGELEKIVATSLENLEFGKTIAQMIQDVGLDGYISVEDNWATQYGIEAKTITGMKFYGTYATEHLKNEKREAIWEDTLVLVTNHSFETLQSLSNICTELNKFQKRKFVIISGAPAAYNAPVVASLAATIMNFRKGNTGVSEILAIKAPSLTTQELEDVAVFCDAKLIDKNAGMELKDIRIEDFGHAAKVTAGEDDVVIIGGRGNVEERIKILSAELKLEKDNMFKEKMKRRIASLSAGVGIIRVGAMTETERDYLKLKIEDAVHAGRAALEEGIVKGGGLALKEIAEELGKDNIIYEALMAPYERIQENAGGELEIGEDILDPVKVTRLAVENACSAAGTLITTETAISERKRSMWDELEKRMHGSDEQDSFRDNENQDLGAGRLVE